MKKEQIFEILEKILATKQKYFDKEQEVILRNTISEDAENFDSELLKLLLSEEKLKEHFFVKVDKVIVFDKDKFLTFVNNKKFLPNSYTRFTQNIGLTEDNHFLKSSGKVVLNWPYKDCVLEGGQTKEEKGRNEIFFNEILEKDEIDSLLRPKAFKKFRKYSRSKGKLKTENLEEFERDEESVIKNNLIIKGNNLLALHSLKEEFAGKVKLIYIDPPYNTGNDGFKYNDNFNHSTWLTFMKNRLEVARDLLRDDGVIFVNIDNNEDAYLKILMDDIFGRENFLSNIIWRHTIQAKNDSLGISLQHNSTLVFKKTNLFKIGRIERTEDHNKNYGNPDKDPLGLWRSGDVRSPSYAKSLIFDIKTPGGKIINSPKFGWRWSLKTINEKIKTREITFNKDESNIIRKIYLKNQKGRVVESFWNSGDVGTSREGTNEMKILFGEKTFMTPKPEKLLKRIIEISTKENDIVLDFFAGSGTTGAVAHKMNRQYILIEQMNYINDLPEARLKKVIEGEQGGISKAVNWKGGGEFVYMEMREFNQEFLDQIKEAKSKKKLKNIFQKMKENAFLSYRFSEKEFEEKVDEFDNLSLDDQKLVLDELLDKNQTYLRYSEIKDRLYSVSKKEIRINESFYNEK